MPYEEINNTSSNSAIGDLKILEVNQDGKFVRLVNDGPTVSTTLF